MDNLNSFEPLVALPVVLRFPFSLGGNLALGALFTAASLARSYALRRVFEHPRKEVAGTLAIRL